MLNLRNYNTLLWKCPRTLVLLVVLTWLQIMFTSCKKTENARPNILWIYLEDTSPFMGCYGSSLVSTPNIDSLAKKGILFKNAFMPAPVCSPCRSSIITGVMSTTIGAHNHHSSRTPESAIHLPSGMLTIPEIFKAAGYFTFNNGKDDYNFDYNRRLLYEQDYLQHPLYGKKGSAIEIASLKEKAPFFGQIQLAGGKEIFSETFQERNISPVDRSKIVLPPFLPKHTAIIEEYANHLDAIQITDRRVGEILKELRENHILDNTIVFFFSDHGMRLTRHKQFLYDGGLHVPLIIVDFREESKLTAGTINEQLVGGIDLGIISLAMAGLTIPSHMEGQNIFDDDIPPREIVISTRDRCDFTIDRIRSVRSLDFKYIRNFMTDRPYSQASYMDADGVEFVQVMKGLHRSNKLDTVQDRFYAEVRPVEELYDLRQDPFEINNLSDHPEYAEVLDKFRLILANWIDQTGDQGQYPEGEEGLKLMLGIWGKHAVNPEYEALRKKHPGLEGSLSAPKNATWQKRSKYF